MRAAARPPRQVACCRSPRQWLWNGNLGQRCGYRIPRLKIAPPGTQTTHGIRWAASNAAVGVRDLDHDTFLEACLERHDDLGDSSGAAVPVTRDRAPGLSIASSPRMRQPPAKLAHFGKWMGLATQYGELRRESDISAEIGPPRLVDDPANANDVELWNVVLHYRYRHDGYQGVSAVMQALQARRALWEVDRPAAVAFWDTILRVAVLHEDALVSVWEYAEWLYEAHGVRWPKLHESVLASFIKRKSPQEAIQWHLRLSPNYALDAPTFAQLLQRFVTDPDPGVQDTLWGLYQTSHHRQLYDTIVPQLYAEGHLALARTWRFRLTLYGDNPESYAARPFLRFMAGYFPRVVMKPREPLAAGVTQEVGIPGGKLTQVEGVGGYRQMINRIHGQTFGIKEKTYNDTLGARWFASSWISVDLALDVVRFLGLDRIGPLSLQSIALREAHPDRVLDRLDQLERSGISIGDSSYAKAVRHLATMDDHDTLTDLLHSDLHPDVFEDAKMQREMLRLAMRTGDWKPYRLVLSVKLAVALDDLALESNRLALDALLTGDKQTTIRMLDDMHKRGAQILPSTSDAISMHIISSLDDVPQVDNGELSQYVAIGRLVMATRFPLATQALRTLLYNLGRRNRLEELERMSMEILQRYSDVRNSARPTLNVHKFDAPDVLSEEHSWGSFQLIPRELNLRHDLHPIQSIFDRGLQHNIIHWSFTARHVSQPLPQFAKNPTQPIDFSFARGIRLLAILRDNGVVFDGAAVKQLRHIVEMELASLLGGGQGRSSKAPRWIARLGVEQAKALCDDAWGGELLPPLRELTQRVEAFVKTEADAAAILDRRATRLDPRIRLLKGVAPTWSLKKHLMTRKEKLMSSYQERE